MIFKIKNFIAKLHLIILKPIMVSRAKNNTKKIRKMLRQGIFVLKYLEHRMIKAGISRQERRIFWRQFGSGENRRRDIIDKLVKHLDLESK